MDLKASIVVITFNALHDLKECLHSLYTQNFKNKEIIIVNDASTDGTDDYLKNHLNKSNTQTTVITNNTNLGVAGARNVGIEHATGEIIAFTDADCIVDSNWISELIKGYTYDGVVAVGGKVLDKRVSNIWELSDKGYDYVASQEGYTSYIVGCNMSFNKNILKKFMFDDTIKYGYEEALLCDQLIANGFKIYYNPEAVVKHKHRTTLQSLMKRKYLLGVSSIWYRQKTKKFIMFKRHLILLIAFLLIPLTTINYLFLYTTFILFGVFTMSLLRDEIIFDKKTTWEIIITFPFLVFLELAHFWGSLSGLIKFRLKS